MRILQARFVGLATMLVAVLFLCVSPGIAQKAGGGTAAPSPVRSAPNPTTTTTNEAANPPKIRSRTFNQ